jgi:hypothetical protein
VPPPLDPAQWLDFGGNPSTFWRASAKDASNAEPSIWRDLDASHVVPRTHLLEFG